MYVYIYTHAAGPTTPPPPHGVGTPYEGIIGIIRFTVVWRKSICCSGTNEVKCILSLHDSDMISGTRRGNYLHRSSTLLRDQVQPPLPSSLNSIDKIIRLVLDCGATVLLSVVGYSFFSFFAGPAGPHSQTHGICQWTVKFMKLHPLNQSVHNDSRNSPLACRSLVCQWKQCWPWPFHSLGWHHLLHQGICWANLARDLASCQGLIHLKSSVVNECWVWVFLSLAFWLLQLQSFFFLLGKKRHAGRS